MKKITLILVLSVISYSLFSQGREQKKAQMEALKVQFFTEELDLTEKESKEFWPVFYQFEKEQKSLKKEIKNQSNSLSEDKITSQKDLINAITEIENRQNLLAENKKEFIKNCIPILGVQKSAKLVSLEDKLRRKLANRLKDRMGEK